MVPLKRIEFFMKCVENHGMAPFLQYIYESKLAPLSPGVCERSEFQLSYSVVEQTANGGCQIKAPWQADQHAV